MLTCLLVQRSNTNMPIAKSPSMTFGESLRTPSRKQKANTSNTSSSTHDHESPMTSSYQQKSSWLHTVRKKFTFNKSPSPSSKRYSRKPIPEFSPADPQESCSTNVHYEHSESRERLEALATTKSHCNTCSKPVLSSSSNLKTDLAKDLNTRPRNSRGGRV